MLRWLSKSQDKDILFGTGFAREAGVKLQSVLGYSVLLVLSASCRVDQAIEAEDSWFYSRRPTQSVATPVGADSLHWTQVGSGPDTLVLVHGFGPYPTVQWQPVVWKFSDTKTLIVVDLLGFGQSTSPDTSIRISQQVEALRSALDAHGIARIHLVGHSYGGMVSTVFASQHPDRLRSLVLIDPLHRHFELSHLDSLQQQWGRPIEEVLLPRDLESYDAMMQLSVYDPFFLPAFMKQQVLENIYSENLKQREAMLRAVRRDEAWIREQARGCSVPTLLVWGAHDALFPPRGAAMVAQDFPLSRTVLSPKAGHLPHMERPFVVLDSLEAFFNDQGPK
jgi:pimeloyl-ACP methyl ester carboxylesterase